MTGRDRICSQSTMFWKRGRGEETMLKCGFGSSSSSFSDWSWMTRPHIVSLHQHGSDGFVQHSDFLWRTDDEWCSCVNNGLATGFAEAQLVSNFNPVCRNMELVTSALFQNQWNRKCVSVKISATGWFLASPVNLDLPVGLLCDANVVQFSSVVLRVHPPQHQLSTCGCFWVSVRNRTQKYSLKKKKKK